GGGEWADCTAMVTEVCAPHKAATQIVAAWPSGPGAGELLHWLVVEVVAERPWPGDRDTALGPPDGITGKGDDAHPLAIPDPLGGDRLGGVAVQHRDQVRHRGEQPAMFESHQILVLQFQNDQPARVRPQALDPYRTAREPSDGPPLD